MIHCSWTRSHGQSLCWHAALHSRPWNVQVRWSEATPGRPPPTAVLVHGVMGSRKNVASFAQRIVQARSWQTHLRQ